MSAKFLTCKKSTMRKKENQKSAKRYHFFKTFAELRLVLTISKKQGLQETKMAEIGVHRN